MHIIVSNDDGVHAPGIHILAKYMQLMGDVTVIAPDQDRSGSSHALSLTHPVRVVEMDDNWYRVSGTPADCVHLALYGLLEKKADIVVSGINNAANLGDDVIYSGTVSAAMEGRYCGLPAIAVSLVTRDRIGEHYATAARAVMVLTEQLLRDPLPADTILNVNVPDLHWDEIEGFEVTRLGSHHRANRCVKQKDPRGRTIWWVGSIGEVDDDGPGTDFNAIARRYISVTPLHADLTRFRALEKVSAWAQSLSAAKLAEAN